ncbi:hypothetical protein EDC14_102134 [Hydrogenispora ethanolica]|uniref:Uncharacterized protein n=2 Tax=Hydrogenispora ethanolica TaxID=1082276 RepID=A0A4R1RC29_HYDET|nr:hypothetical protein EDC14_102134 [Hydrogenispora ethanolica]
MKYMRKADIVLIAALVVSAPVFWFLNRHFAAEKGVYAEIYHDSVLVYRIKLSTAKEGSFSIPGEPDVVFHQYADGSIAFIKSDCPDKICIRSGRLKNAGQFAACLPNKVMLKIVSEEKDREAPDLIIE